MRFAQKILIVSVALLCLAFPTITAEPCMACTLIVGFVEELAYAQKLNVVEAGQTLCNDITFSNKYLLLLCSTFINPMLPLIQIDYKNGKTPDYTCHNTLKLCTGDQAQCKLFKTWPPAEYSKRTVSDRYHPKHFNMPEDSKLSVEQQQTLITILHFLGLPLERNSVQQQSSSEADITQKESLKVPANKHLLPVFDTDGDKFSTVKELRGTHWRGKDCSDIDATVYPGRMVTYYGPEVDHNCNGIYGVDEQGRSYEDLFCSNSGSRGMIAIGDSATAHFSMPPSWFRAGQFNDSTFHDIFNVAFDEGDWPQCSLTTGYEQDAKCPPAKVPMNSIYQRLRERNRCNHRDYQNIGVNGNTVVETAPPGVVLTMKSRNGTDNPALIYYSLIGNDVCGRAHNFEHMTQPDVFEKTVLEALEYLDQNLAPNSYVVMSSLVDGRVLYDTVHDHIHPIGVPYPDFYDFLNCLVVSPCWGWMNLNETIRNKTTEHAQLLSSIYPKIIASHSFKNFKMAYFNLDVMTIFKNWVNSGHDAIDLIEPSDGFHPSQTGGMLIADSLWRFLETNLPEALGDINPYNDQIVKLFGNQGGY